jgi:hypothetical protein
VFCHFHLQYGLMPLLLLTSRSSVRSINAILPR